MLVSDTHEIGNRLLMARKKARLTQAELAERAGLADRTYADIERGEANMRVETLLRICRVLKITPDDVLTRDEQTPQTDLNAVLRKLEGRSPKDRNTAAMLLSVYLNSLD